MSNLSDARIQFLVVGGLAVNAYGGPRPLNDIDIDVPDAALGLLAERLRPFVSSGPERLVEDPFDCAFLSLTSLGQVIELSGADTFKIKDKSSREWIDWTTDLSASEWRTVLGATVPVMRRDKLIAYKQAAGRDTDLQDVAFLQSLSATR